MMYWIVGRTWRLLIIPVGVSVLPDAGCASAAGGSETTYSSLPCGVTIVITISGNKGSRKLFLVAQLFIAPSLPPQFPTQPLQFRPLADHHQHVPFVQLRMRVGVDQKLLVRLLDPDDIRTILLLDLRI